ncbi:MAG: helix-turn-helix transcriptional regulator [Actinomycetota bacterium]
MPWKSSLVGRAEEMAFLRSELQRASSGEFRIVLLLGDPGMGKSRLAQELVAAHSTRALALTARAFPLGGTASFALWAEAIECHFRSLSGEAVSQLCGGYIDDLAALLRSVAAIRGQPPLDAQLRPQLLEGLAVVIGNLARQKPLVIFLDDVHLADASSWQALDYLARNLPASRVLLVAAARPADLENHQTAVDVLLGLEQAGQAQRIKLSPLTPEGLGELTESVVGASPPHRLVEWLANKTRGNPLFTLILLQGLKDEGADLSAPDLKSIPEGLSERVGRQLTVFDKPTVATLEILAVLGSRVEIGDLVQVTGRPLERLAEILHTLVRSRLVADEERGPVLTYEIAHPLIQETLYDSIGSGRRRALHRLAGRALLDGGRLGAAAPHFARSADRGDAEAIVALRDAFREAEAREAYGEGLSILSALVQILPYGDPRWLEVFDAMRMGGGRVFRGGVEARLAIDALRAIDFVLVDSPDPARRAAVKFRLASFLAWGSGDLLEGEECCTEALELYEQAGDRSCALVAANELAYIRGLRGDLLALEAGASAVAVSAEREGEPFALMQALGAVGTARIFLGRFDEAEAAFQRDLEIAGRSGKPHRVTFTQSLLACTLALSGRVPDAVSLIEHAKAVNPAYSESMLLESDALIRWIAGDFQACKAAADEVARRSTWGLSRRRGWALAFGALAASERGLDGEARRFVERGLATYMRRPWLWFTDVFTWVEGVSAWREGRTAEGRGLITRAATRLQQMAVRPWAAFALVDLVELAYEEGDAGLCDSTSRSLAALAATIGAPTYHGLAAIGAGWAAVANGDVDAAVRYADEAVGHLTPTGSAAFTGRALELRAVALLHGGRPGAVDAFTEAAETYRACGAAFRHRRAVERLRDLGTRGRRAAGAALGPDSLTRREREVVRLAAEGRTHREIGDRLFIGSRTVETHLANAYAKLGIVSKVDLVRRSAELDLF